jgi:integrase
MAWQDAARRPTTTIKLRSYHIRRFAHFVRLPPEQVTLEHVVAYMGQPGWSPGYSRSMRSTLRSFFLWAYKHNGLASNPAEDAPSVVTTQGKARPAPDAAISALATATDKRVRLMGRLGNELGMRCCEIALVHADDVRGERGLRSLLVHGKGNKERLIPLSDALAELLLAHDGYLFPGQVDGHLSAAYVSKLLSRAMGDTGTAHRLRHRAGTRWLRTSGGNLRVAQELLGHASVATTQIYTHVDDDELRMAVMAA